MYDLSEKEGCPLEFYFKYQGNLENFKVDHSCVRACGVRACLRACVCRACAVRVPCRAVRACVRAMPCVRACVCAVRAYVRVVRACVTPTHPRH
jgi:hypothetical protein